MLLYPDIRTEICILFSYINVNYTYINVPI